ncbi:MAG: DUF6785 family protein [Thermofilaceae archaeon]
MGAREAVERVSGLKPWIIAYAIIFPPIAFFFNNWMQSLGRWWLWPAIIPLPMIWYLILFYALEKATRGRVSISPQEMTLFTVINFITAGSMYVSYGLHYWTSVPLITWNYAHFIFGNLMEPYSAVYRKLFPSYIAPLAEDRLNAFYYGGHFNFAVWLPSMVFWMIWAIALFCGGLLWAFPLRKPLIEVERMPFPGIMPTVYIVESYYTIDEDKRRRLFNLASLDTRIFWIGFLVGALSSAPIVINAFLPSPWLWYIHQFPVDLLAITSGILPGATFAGALYITDVFVGQFMSLDVLATAVLWWFIWGVLYQTIGVRAGFLPYTPGSTGTEFAWTVGPWKWMRFSWHLSIGLGLWMLINYRQHILSVLRAGFRGGGKAPAEEEGVPYRLIVWGGILAWIVLVALMVAGGVNPIFAVVIVPFYVLFMWGWTRMMGEAQEFMPSVPFYNILAYGIGQAVGAWGPAPDPRALPGMAFYYSFGMGGARMSSLAMHHHFKSYRLAANTKTLARDVLIVSLITIITTSIFGYLTWPWWYAYVGGYARSRAIEYHVWNLGGPWSFSYGTPPPIPLTEEIGYVAAAVIFTFLVYWARLRFPWFFLNPIGMMVLPHWWWPTWLVAFLLKFIVIKIGGARLHDKYVIPFSAGYCAGYGAIVIITAFIAFFTFAYPEFIARVAGG